MDKETKAAERVKAERVDKSDVKHRDKDHGPSATNSKSPKKRRKVNHGKQKPAQLSATQLLPTMTPMLGGCPSNVRSVAAFGASSRRLDQHWLASVWSSA